MRPIHSAVKSFINTRSYSNSIVPLEYGAANSISGGNAGNQLVNSNYQFNCKLVRIDENTVYCYNRIGEDTGNFQADVTPRLGSMVKRKFDIPTKTWSAADVVVYSAPIDWTVHSFKPYIVNGSIWIYATKLVRSTYPQTTGCTNSLFKSTDGLIGESFTETSLGINEQFLDIWALCTAQNGSKFLIVGNGNPNLQILRSTDGGNTFTVDSSVDMHPGSNHVTEGQFIQLDESPNVIIGVLRDNNGNNLLQTTSSDWGLTWSNPITNTGLGAATGAKVTPKILRAANNPNSVVMYFNDRGIGNRNRLSGVTPISEFISNIQRTTSFIGTQSTQGNGDFLEIDKNNQIYLVVTYLSVTNPSGVPSANNTNTVWWLWQDLYTKSLSPVPYV
jgi:hypothetical protein